ncbi:MAG: response regulator, partial [Desulfobulbaceae bacterium]|nr:response regulator [Candidatus Desulfobia pelagia]
MIIEVGAQMLKSLGYKVLIAHDGNEAIEIYKENQKEIDIVLMDMIMPNLGGGEAFDYLRKINPNVKVLLNSGYSIEGG